MKFNVPVIVFAAALLLFDTWVGVQVLTLHVDSVPSESVYPVEQEEQILAPCEVQADPVKAIPLEHAHIFCVQTRSAADEHILVSLVPVLQAERHSVQVLKQVILVGVVPVVSEGVDICIMYTSVASVDMANMFPVFP